MRKIRYFFSRKRIEDGDWYVGEFALMMLIPVILVLMCVYL